MFITLEGIEGSGKSTLAKLLNEKLSNLGYDIVLTREPGDNSIGKEIRQILLNPDNKIDAQTELFLFLADRRTHVSEIILPNLADNKVIICDRFTDSTLAYQAYGRGLNLAELENMNKLACGNLVPDLTILLDLPVETGLNRAKNRNSLNLLQNEARFDMESIEFHQKIRNGFLELAQKNENRYEIIDATLPPHKICSHALEVVLHKLVSAGK